MPKTDVRVKLVGEDGNVFSIIGRVAEALRKNGFNDLAKEYKEKALSLHNYSDVLVLTMDYIVEGSDDEEFDDEEEDYDFDDYDDSDDDY